MLKRLLFGRSSAHSGSLTSAQALYAAAVRQSRRPEFFGAGRVSDTVEGRFELLALHGFLILHRLKREGEAARRLAQDVFDTMFEDLDRNLREIGIGDLSVGKRVRLLAENFYGRIRAYEEGLSDPREKLDAAISRNVLANAAEPAVSPDTVLPFARAVADYVRRETAALAVQPLRDLEAGRVAFGPAPSFNG